MERLTALRVEKLRGEESPKPGMYADGGGLYLRVTPKGARSDINAYLTVGIRMLAP